MATRIRLVEPADGDALAAIYRPAVTDVATSFELVPPDGAEMMRRAARVLERTPWLVHERDGVVVGYAYGGIHRERAAYQWTVEVSAYVHQDAHRTGVGRALYRSLFAALTVQGFCGAVAGVTLPNPGSIALHTAIGFTQVGVYHRIGHKFGRWHDVAWFERTLRTDATPAPPRLLPDCRNDADFRAALDAGWS